MERKELVELVASQAGDAIANALDLAITQRIKGASKYGVSIEDAVLSASQLVQHLREELADASVYSAQLQSLIDKELHEARASTLSELKAVAAVTPNDAEFGGLVRELLSDVQLCSARTLYVDALKLFEFNAGDRNLIAMARTPVFPLTTPVTVIS